MYPTRYFSLPLLLAGLGLLAGPRAQAQAPAWQSLTAAAIPSGSSAFIVATASGSAGEVYAVGEFSGTLTLGATTLTSAGGSDFFVARWDESTRAWAWARRAGGAGADHATAVATGSGGLYVAGSFSDTVLFGTTALTTTVQGGALFVGKLTATGTAATWAWATAAAGTGTRTASTLSVQGTSVYVGGSFTQSATFGAATISEQGGGDGFVAKLTDAGAAATWGWAQAVGGPAGSDAVVAVVASGGSVYVAGNNQGTNPVFGSTLLAPTGTGPMFVAKLTDAGAAASFAWARLFGTLTAVTSRSPSTAVVGLVAQGTTLYVLGNYNNAGVEMGTLTLPNAGFYDCFVLKVTDAGPSGTLGWAQAIGGSYYDVAYGLALSGSSLYVVGTFGSPTLTVGGSTLSPVGTYDLFVARLDDAGATGSWAWAQRAGGGPSAQGTAVSVSSLGTVCVSGSLLVPAAFGSLTTTGPAGGSVLCLATLGTATGLATAPAAAPLAGLALYPNPARRTTTVQLPAGLAAGPATLALLDNVGRTVRTRTVALAAGSSQLAFDVAGLAPGVYALRVAVGERLGTARLVVE
jgi:hypothetical protein